MLNIRSTEITTSDNQVARIEYDPEADILEVFFDSVQATTAVHLHDSIVLRLDQEEGRPSGLIRQAQDRRRRATKLCPIISTSSMHRNGAFPPEKVTQPDSSGVAA